MPASLSDVARMAGVSLGTASSVLTARDGFRVSADTAARIRKAADQLNYRPNRLARALATGKTRLIALIDYDFGASFSTNLGRQLHLALAADSYNLVIFGETTASHAIATIVDGAIVCSREMPGGLDDVLPVVHISPNPDTRQDALLLDFEPATSKAMRVFELAGCKTVAFLGCVSRGESRDGRLVGYQKFVKETGRKEVLIGSAADRQSDGYDSLLRYVSANPWPHAIFCGNDELAMGAYRATREAGLEVGRDVAIIGCDDIVNDYSEPPLSSLALPFEEISRVAWNLLRERIESTDVEPRVIAIAPQLVERASSGFAGPH